MCAPPVLAQTVMGSGTPGTVPIWMPTATPGTATSMLSDAGPAPWFDVTSIAFQGRADWAPSCIPQYPPPNPPVAGKCTDNAPAVTAAITACAAISGNQGCTIFFPNAGTGSSTGSYFVGATGINVRSSSTTPLHGVKLVGDCSSPGSGIQVVSGAGLTAQHCSTLVTNGTGAPEIVKVGVDNAVTFGFGIQNLSFYDDSGGTAIGAIHLENVDFFNLTDVACSNFKNTSTSNEKGFCFFLNGQSETQYGVIVNPSVSSTRHPIQTKGNGVSEINFYGGEIDCTNPSSVLANSIGMDIGSTSTPTTANGEWGVYGTHILNCNTGVAMVDTNVMQWYGVMEIAGVSNTGTVGFQIDSSTAGSGKGGGNLIGGSINNYETGVKIGQTLSGAPLATRITASITNATTPLSIKSTSLPSTLILTPDGTIGSSQIGSDLALFSQTATPRALLTTIQNGSTAANKLATLTSSGTVNTTTVSDTQSVGIVVAGSGTMGAAQIATVGQAMCAFDSAPNAVGDFVTISPITAGDCHDYGTSTSPTPLPPPPTGQNIGKVLSTTGVSGLYPMSLFGPGVAGPAPTARNSVTLTDEFFNASVPATNTAGPVGDLGWITNNSGTASKVAGSANHPGVLRFTTASANGSISTISLGTTSVLPVANLSGLPWRQVAAVRVRMGFADNITFTSTPPSNGIYFEGINGTGATWNGMVASGGVITASVTGSFSFSAGVFHTFEIRNDPFSSSGNNVTFWVDGTLQGSGAITSGIPSNAPMVPFVEIVNTGTSARSFDIDTFQFTLQVNR
jgi:hypothetical protein